MPSTTNISLRGRSPQGRLTRLALRGTLALALAAGGLAAVAPAAQAATTVTFSYTGGPQTFTVPDGVTSIEVDAFGAQGQAGPGETPGGAGGLGGEVKATLAVTPGQELQIIVGGTGGYGGGGPGGKGGNIFGYLDGGAGGGASDVRTGPGYGLDDRVLVAGGGGGGGNYTRVAAGAGGDGGGAAGTPGGSSSLGSNPGGGGTSSAGGSGGAGSYGADAGADGTAGTGGAGGAEVPGGPSGAGGGGGGGGWYGGGGGGGGEYAGAPIYARSSAGGGGGSGHGPAGTVFQTGVRSGNGLITITYTPPGADLAVTVTDSADPVTPGTPVTYSVTVTNNGPRSATGVSAVTTLSGVARTIGSATPSQGSCAIAAPTVTCPLGTLAAGASATIAITVTPTAVGTLTATTNVSGTEPDTDPANNSDAGNTTVAAADIDVNLGTQPHLGILVPYLQYTLTADNTGPSPLASATLTATLPTGASATNLSTGCTSAGTTVTCTYGAIASGASVDKTFRIPLSLLSLGQVTVTGVRTTSAPADPNPANDSASATCTVISVVLVTCP
ncbi:DUF11 domain-containing protein [Nonomuraea sp. NPDC048881]|uniref:DUF11 domain-containing protein n=1 Tax=Nonomuraea sp. NPDC048881 TaxID=3155030 RepID=UPI0033E8A9B6